MSIKRDNWGKSEKAYSGIEKPHKLRKTKEQNVYTY